MILRPAKLSSLWLCLLLLYTLRLSSQPDSTITLFHYTADNGLPQNSIKGIVQDSSGAMWMATEMGMVWFDGRNFRVFNKSNTPEFPLNRISALYTLPGNRHIFNIYTDTSSFFLINNSSLAPGVHRFTKLASRKETGLAGVVLSFFPKLNNAVFKQKNSSFTKNLIQFGISKMIFQDTDKMYFLINDSLFFLNNSSGKILPCDVRSHVIDMYIGGSQLLVFTEQGMKVVRAGRVIPTLPASLSNIATSPDFIRLKQKLPTNHESLFQYNPFIYRVMDSAGHIVCRKLATIPANARSITSLFYNEHDRQIFIGSPDNGLHIIQYSNFFVKKFNRISGNMFYSHVLTKRGDIISAIGRLNKNGSQQLSNNAFVMLAFLRDSNQHIWAVDLGYHLYKGDENFENKRLMASTEHQIDMVTADPFGRVWVSTPYAAGIMQPDGIKWVFEKIPFNTNNSPIQSLFFAGDEVWVSTEFAIYRYNYQTDKWNSNPIPIPYTRGLSLDRNNQVWIGSYGNGFYLYHKGKAVRMPEDPVGILQTVHCFYEDNNGYLWMSTNNGIVQARKKDLEAFAEKGVGSIYYYYYDKQQGFLNNELNGGCVPCKSIDAEGRLMFPSMEGLVGFSPDRTQPLLPYRPIYIGEVRQDTVLLNGDKPFSLSPSFNQLAIQVFSPYYGPKANERLEYRLPGILNNWVEVPQNGQVIFSRLSYGDYELEFRKMTGFGENNITYRRLAFHVNPFWYQTWLFRLAVLLAIVITVVGLYRARTHRLIKRKKELEIQVSQQTKELKERLDELAASRRQLEESKQLNERMASVVLHDIRSPLQFISIVSKELVEVSEAMQLHEISDIAKKLQHSAADTYHFSSNFMEWMKVNKDNLVLMPEWFPLKALLDDITRLYGNIVKAKGNHFEIKVSSDLFMYTDKNLVHMIIRNLVDNANKHTQNGSISISADKIDKVTTIIVEDTGKGIPMSKLQYIQSIFKRKATGDTRQTHLGFYIIGEMVNKINGSCSIVSRESSGVTVFLHLGDMAEQSKSNIPHQNISADQEMP